MVFGSKPECSVCKVVESTIWQKDENDKVICNPCFCKSQSPKFHKVETLLTKGETIPIEIDELKSREDHDESKMGEDDSQTLEDVGLKDGKDKRKESKRKVRRGRHGGKNNIPKGKGRRYIFKKSAAKAPMAVATPVTSDFLFYKGTYYQVGNIVSLLDVSGKMYYAQIRGLLQDQYCEKSAVLTWLVPTKDSPPPADGFDPSSYIIGPEEDVPRKLEFMEFVCHAPSDYFKDRTSPYSTTLYQPQSCFVWSRLGPQIKPIDKAKELMAK